MYVCISIIYYGIIQRLLVEKMTASVASIDDDLPSSEIGWITVHHGGDAVGISTNLVSSFVESEYGPMLLSTR